MILLILLEELFLRNSMPTFDVKLKPNDFSENEVVTGSISSTRGTVENWNPNTGILRVSNTDGFVVNDVLKGLIFRNSRSCFIYKNF